MSKRIGKEELLEKIVADYTKRTRAGKAPDIAKYKKKYPMVADEIDDLLSSVAMIEGLKVEANSETESKQKENELSNLKQLGDYLLIRVVGRGGMGIVFEAIHQSLGRKVALKVMREKEIDDEKYIARFRREAQAAAKLHHTNIVSVFGVGESNGYHYYVMEYIDGAGLNSVVDSLTKVSPSETLLATKIEDATRLDSGNADTMTSSQNLLVIKPEKKQASPTVTIEGVPQDRKRYPWVANIGSQIADALGYSHQYGVLHRDIKPANLLLDRNDHVWITDFGLVKLAEEDALTKTGAVIGTPRYLAPESLKGQYDERSETYCLGLTLYELATLTPAYAPGTTAEVLNQVINETPPSPAKLDPHIPKDLNTIIEKAISKSPEHRYQSAYELRDDLRAFMEDRPISARRPSVFEQALRWGRKNPWIASLAALSAILICAVAITASWAYVGTTKAYGALKDEAAKTEAARKDAVENLKLARENGHRASTNVTLMLNAFDDMFKQVIAPNSGKEFKFDSFNELGGIETSVTVEDAQFLKKMLSHYEKFAQQNSGNSRLIAETAKAYRRVANINFLIGQPENAIRAYQEALKDFELVLSQNPDSTQAIVDVINTRSELSAATRRGNRNRFQDSKSDGNRFQESIALIGKNLQEFEKHPKRHLPEVRFALAKSLISSASAEVNRVITIQTLEEAPETFTERRSFQKLNGNNPPHRYNEQAAQYMRRAISVAQELISESPENPDYRALLAECLSSRGASESRFGQPEKSIETLTLAIDQFESLAQQFKDNLNYQYRLVVTYLLMPNSAPTQSALQIGKAKKMAKALVDKSPNPEFKQAYVLAYLKMADFYLDRNKQDEALEEFVETIRVFRQMQLEGEARVAIGSTLGRTYQQDYHEAKIDEGTKRIFNEARDVMERRRRGGGRPQERGWPQRGGPDHNFDGPPRFPGDRRPPPGRPPEKQ